MLEGKNGEKKNIFSKLHYDIRSNIISNIIMQWFAIKIQSKFVKDTIEIQ